MSQESPEFSNNPRRTNTMLSPLRYSGRQDSSSVECCERDYDQRNNSPVKQIRVLIADDRALVRGGIRAQLDKVPELQIVAEASDGAEALRLIMQHQPDVAVIESAMSRLNGF